jgi:hypothetical protein
MPVVDASGRQLGKVVRVQMAPTPVRNPPHSDILDEMSTLLPSPPEMSEAGAELDILGASPVGHNQSGLPDLPEEVRSHLERVGFIEIEGPDLGDADRFLAADQVEEITDERVVVRSWTSA